MTTVPRPGIECTDSTGKRKGLSNSRTGVGMKASTSFKSCEMASEPISGLFPSNAHNADPVKMITFVLEQSYYTICVKDHCP